MTNYTQVDVISSTLPDKKAIKRKFPHINLTGFTVEQHPWTRGQLGEIYGTNQSEITKDIKALMEWRGYDGSPNYMQFLQIASVNFEQGFYIYLLRLWLEQMRLLNSNKRPLRRVFVRDYLSEWEECENGYYMPRLEDFCRLVDFSLRQSPSGANSIKEDYKNRLEDYLVANQGRGILLSRN